ncbi:MAG: hypothetical protein HOI53_00620 [Francisellaceae bacterium]|jgi:hypothetical protein|nr:hypothetical protein [Francisellaceae bacterium]MBT6206503.1 hypothetical protein [Francisellaceae bacterium]MBT6539715.1 hypothetical protein [Francisellaceae bacterium]
MRVKYLLFIFILFPICCFAKSFIAEVSEIQIDTNSSVILTLTLTDATAKAEPDINLIKDNFNIIGKQTFSSIQSIQWKKTSSIAWQYTLTPKIHGQITIPSFKIETTTGMLRTDSIILKVIPADTSNSINNPHNGPALELNLKIIKPSDRFYIKQPIIFDLELDEKRPTANLQLDESKSSEYSIEQIDGPLAAIKTDSNGNQRRITKIKYLMVANKSGQLTFPLYTVNGYERTSNNNPSSDPFAAFNSSIFRSQFDDLKPFASFSPTFDVNISDHKSNSLNSWLPAEEITITDALDHMPQIKAGDPITRTITITGKGTLSTNLPHDALMLTNDEYKVYADKTTAEQEYKGNDIIATVKHTYTIIPTKHGQITFPQISIPWWNTVAHKAENYKLKYTTFDILPVIPIEPTKTSDINNETVSPVINDLNLTQILLITAIVLLVFLITIFIYTISRKNHFKLPKYKIESSTSYSNEVHINDINDPKLLAKYLSNYFIDNYGIQKNTALKLIPQYLASSHTNMEALTEVINTIDNIRFKGRTYNLAKLKEEVSYILKNIKQRDTNKEVINLNPH